MREPSRVLIIGAGVTGALTSLLLKRTFNDRLRIEIWDKSRGIGGRMSTTRPNRETKLSCDLGLQYISITPTQWERHRSLYEELLLENVLVPFERKIVGMRECIEGTRHFIAPQGSSSVPRYFIKQSGSLVHQNLLLNAINVVAGRFQACATDSSQNKPVEDYPDIIILSIPIPQILNLSGDIKSMLVPFRAALHGITYSSRYALGLFYPDMTVLPGLDWCAKYVYDNVCIRYIAIDTEKRGADPKNGLSMTVHASVPFSKEHLDKNLEEVREIILSHLQEILPDLPKPEIIKTHRWRFSQVSKPFPGEPGSIIVNNLPLIICAGDGFTDSKFDNCVKAAYSVVEKLTASFEQ